MWNMDYDSAAEYWEEKDRASVPADREVLKQKIEEYIAANNTCALATALGDFVRCTPIEYTYLDGRFYLFSEGGLKFRALKENSHVCLAVFDSWKGFGTLRGLQVTGTAEPVEPFSGEYLRLMEVRKIPEAAMRKLPKPMNLLRVTPVSFDFLDSEFKALGFGNRQHLDV